MKIVNDRNRAEKRIIFGEVIEKLNHDIDDINISLSNMGVTIISFTSKYHLMPSMGFMDSGEAEVEYMFYLFTKYKYLGGTYENTITINKSDLDKIDTPNVIYMKCILIIHKLLLEKTSIYMKESLTKDMALLASLNLELEQDKYLLNIVEYNLDGTISHTKNINGDEEWWSYDGHGRLTNIKYSKPFNGKERHYTIKYNENGKMIYYKDSRCNEEWSRVLDDQDRVIVFSSAKSEYSYVFEYNDKGDRITTTRSDGEIAIDDYDSRGHSFNLR